MKNIKLSRTITDIIDTAVLLIPILILIALFGTLIYYQQYLAAFLVMLSIIAFYFNEQSKNSNP